MINAINQFCHDYYNQLPVDGLKVAGLSAVYSFTASLTVVMLRIPFNQPPNLSRPALAAGIAFFASAIHVLALPIFNYLFDNPKSGTFNGFQEFIKLTIDLTFVHVLINNTTAFKINLLTGAGLKNGSFPILPSNFFKIVADIYADICIRCSESVTGTFIRTFCTTYLGMDFNDNSTPIYITV
jgi:hypothetical protein